MKKGVLTVLVLVVVASAGVAYWKWSKGRGVSLSQVRESFLSSCLDAAIAGRDAQKPAADPQARERARVYCECALQSVLKRFSLEELAGIDKTMQASGTIDPAVQKRLTEAVGECSLEGAQEKAAAPAKP